MRGIPLAVTARIQPLALYRVRGLHESGHAPVIDGGQTASPRDSLSVRIASITSRMAREELRRLG